MRAGRLSPQSRESVQSPRGVVHDASAYWSEGDRVRGDRARSARRPHARRSRRRGCRGRRPDKAALGDPDRPLSEGPLRRGKRVIPLNLKRPEQLEEALTLIETADVLIEGNRPGVMERLGLAPAECAKRNPRLIYGRMTGWGQDGRSRRSRATTSTILRSAEFVSRARSAAGCFLTGALGLAFG